MKWFLIGFMLSLIAILICYSILSVISAKRMIEVYNNKLDQVEIVEKDEISDQASLYDLLDKKAFLASQSLLMNSDSLNLIVDLKDSVLKLVIEGVEIHVTNLTGYRVSHFFKALSNSAYIQIFSKPLNVESFESTIVKEPITIKQAPKDTAEAANFFEMPDTLISDFVAVSMKLNHNFILTFQQEEKLTSSRLTWDRFFILKLRLSKIRDDFQEIIRMRLPQYEPEIRITLAKDDLVTVFRALPQSTWITIRLR